MEEIEMTLLGVNSWGHFFSMYFRYVLYFAGSGWYFLKKQGLRPLDFFLSIFSNSSQI